MVRSYLAAAAVVLALALLSGGAGTSGDLSGIGITFDKSQPS
jgi:hypothetical protein